MKIIRLVEGLVLAAFIYVAGRIIGRGRNKTTATNFPARPLPRLVQAVRVPTPQAVSISLMPPVVEVPAPMIQPIPVQHEAAVLPGGPTVVVTELALEDSINEIEDIVRADIEIANIGGHSIPVAEVEVLDFVFNHRVHDLGSGVELILPSQHDPVYIEPGQQARIVKFIKVKAQEFIERVSHVHIKLRIPGYGVATINYP